MTEWGTAHAPDPEELVDFMTTEGCGPVQVPHIEPHPVPLHAPEEGLLDEEILPLRKDWQRGPVYNPVDSGYCRKMATRKNAGLRAVSLYIRGVL